MATEWRRDYNNDQEEDRVWPSGNNYQRPPPISGCSSPKPVPRWEKKFCFSSCSISWKKLCETKKVIYMYPRVAEWNDSAGKEAFHNAKARYWAEINCLPCNIPLPDPNMYIDVVDHNVIINPELVEDLDKQPPLSEGGEEDTCINWPSFLFTNDTVPVTGWGDEEDTIAPAHSATNRSTAIQPTGWTDPIQPIGWDDIDDPVAIKNAVDAKFENSVKMDRFGNSQINDWHNYNEPGRRYGRKRDGGRLFGLKYIHGRYQGENHHTSYNWRTFRGRKKENDTYEQPLHHKPPLAPREWNSMHFCSPTNQ